MAVLSPDGELPLLVALLIVSAFFSGSEVGFLAVGTTRVRQLRDSGVRSAAWLSVLLAHRGIVLSTILIGITASNYTAESLAVAYASELHPTLGPLIAAIAMTVIVMVFCEVTPIEYAARNTERTALRSALPIALFSLALLPVVIVLAAISRLILRIFGLRARTVLPSVTEEHLKAMIEQSEEQGAIAATERRMLRGVLEFGDHTVAQIMTPRPDMVCVEESETLRKALDLGLGHRNSRLPVYRGTTDDIVGVLYMKDLLPYALEDDLERPASSVARPAYHVPESLLADDLLEQLRREHQMMAIVKDEYGGTAGLVTIEDLLEEIVGDIQDEYDNEEPEVVEVGEHELLCHATVSLHELADHLEWAQLPTDDYESLGGLVLDQLGHIPVVGESVEYGTLSFTVESMTGPRLEKIKVLEHGHPAEPD